MSDWQGEGTKITEPVSTVVELPVTLQELKNQLRILASDEDDYLNSLISRATDTAERFINNAIAKRQYTYIVEDPSETNTIFIPVWPVNEITSIKVTYEDASESADIKANAVVLNTIPVQLRPTFTFSTTLVAEYLTIVYNAGTGTDAPEHIKQAILLLAGDWYEHRETTKVGNIVNELPYGVKMLLGMSCEYNI